MPKPLTQCKVLIVEDIPENRLLVRQLLTRLGVTIAEAEDGLAAIELARRERPDLILMDLSLPLLDGWQATERLKRDPLTAGIPVVAVTAHGTAEDERRARALGCDGFMRKPIDTAGFLAEVSRRLGAGP